jgi:hypothetical protein
MVIVFNATFNNISTISGRSVLLVEENGIPGENFSVINIVLLTRQVQHILIYILLTAGYAIIKARAVVVVIVWVLHLQLPTCVCNQCLSPLML